MGSSDGEGLLQLYLKLVDAHKKRRLKMDKSSYESERVRVFGFFSSSKRRNK